MANNLHEKQKLVNEMRITKLQREAKDTERFGILVKYLCLSAMCKHHSHLFGELIDYHVALSLYSLDMVPDDCRCAVSQVLVDENGEMRSKALKERIAKQREKLNNP